LQEHTSGRTTVGNTVSYDRIDDKIRQQDHNLTSAPVATARRALQPPLVSRVLLWWLTSPQVPCPFLLFAGCFGQVFANQLVRLVVWTGARRVVKRCVSARAGKRWMSRGERHLLVVWDVSSRVSNTRAAARERLHSVGGDTL